MDSVPSHPRPSANYAPNVRDSLTRRHDGTRAALRRRRQASLRRARGEQAALLANNTDPAIKSHGFL